MKLIIEDREHAFDLDGLTFPEGIALEEEWGVQVADFETQLKGGTPSMRIITALMWLMQVRGIAADQNIPVPAAARQLPVATYALKFSAIKQPLAEPENPTDAGTRTPGTRTTRATSGKPKPKRATTGSGAAST
jgi:hypothetical protein